jgi:hypothetical protein
MLLAEPGFRVLNLPSTLRLLSTFAGDSMRFGIKTEPVESYSKKPGSDRLAARCESVSTAIT